ncbi:hypothetical protein U9M48_012883 [Paspalum notatum var. saurae]|uniref:Uncharacterized protein n=1 Tax=Paspalum notatum var. saurae TaxID=547442 RepID=A0AAQ3WJ31_PASNO
MQQQQDDDTVNAAAIVLAAAARSTTTGLLRQRHQQLDDDDHASGTTTKRTRWWSRLKAKLMRFRPHGQPQRIADASPERPPGAACAEHTAASSSGYYYSRQAPQPALAFVAPPSSPASSVLTSEPPSPVVLLNADISSGYSSPMASIFAIGPYAREPQQLVSPPAFSAGLTEPSTAPLTPPPESGLHLLATTPSSPEVPFARFLSPPPVAAAGQQLATEGYFLHAYQLHPGSPILVSPGSTSSSPAPQFWKMQHRVRSHNEGSLLDGIPSTDDGCSDCASSSGSVVRRQDDGTHDDEAATVGGEFVFGNNADAVAGGEVGVAGDGSLALGDATEQWPFLLSAQSQRSS